MDRATLTKCIESGLPPIAGIILIVAAGGGFKQVLVDSGIGTMLARWAEGVHISVLVLAWVLAVLIRLATGSATVATITASSLILGLVEGGMSTGQVSLVVLAVGAGSLFFSHVNDAGGSGWSISTSGSASGRPSRPGRSWRRCCRSAASPWCSSWTSSSSCAHPRNPLNPWGDSRGGLLRALPRPRVDLGGHLHPAGGVVDEIRQAARDTAAGDDRARARCRTDGRWRGHDQIAIVGVRAHLLLADQNPLVGGQVAITSG